MVDINDGVRGGKAQYATEKFSVAEFRDDLKTWLEERDWSLATMAKAAGISAATLSQFAAGKYPGDVLAVYKKVLAVMAREKDKSASPKIERGFIETSASKRVFEIARNCHVVGEIGVCYSAAGLGKTESVREYTRRHSDVILIEADPCYTAKVLFGELRELIGGTSRGNLYDVFVECCRRLKGSGRLLIVDEAEQLPYKALELLRRLHDKTGIGILLTGMPKLLANLKGLNGEYAQLYSRVGIAIKLIALKEKDTSAILAVLLPDCGETLHKAFHRESAGNTRRLFKIVTRSQHIAKINNMAIDESVIEAAGKFVKLEAMS
ncbi:MAG: AAA family ATPase [Chitinispirillia bacterium]|nr:AAA family ATPase [Chitinispirillia bacterium]